MPSVGHILRGARLQAGLALEQISLRTRISVKNLRAIEEDDLGQITSAFFYKSFVRQFCEQVSLPYEELSGPVLQAAEYYPEPFSAGQLEAVLQRTLVKPRKRNIDFRVPVAVGSLAVVLVACSSLYAFWREGGGLNAKGEVKKLVQTGEAYLLGHDTGRVADAPARPKISGERPKEADISPTLDAAASENGFRVELSAIEPSWLSITADGRQTFSGILEPDQSKVIEGHETGRLRTGNAGGVKVVFNGKPVGVVGPRGQVRIVVFTKDDYEVLDPSPTHVAGASGTIPNLLATRVDWSAPLPLIPPSQ